MRTGAVITEGTGAHRAAHAGWRMLDIAAS
jgi:hypothetical protein